jgi:apolipoprotein N-acyltransferase
MDLFEEGILMTQVAGNTYRSIYSYVGDWINILVVTATLFLGFTGAGRKSARKKGR